MGVGGIVGGIVEGIVGEIVGGIAGGKVVIVGEGIDISPQSNPIIRPVPFILAGEAQRTIQQR